MLEIKPQKTFKKNEHDMNYIFFFSLQCYELKVTILLSFMNMVFDLIEYER